MLLAEIHGRYVQEALSFEDYLTSAVFGHLRYIPPGRFWEAFLASAVSLPVNGGEVSALEHLQEVTGTPIAAYESLEIIFWPTHPQGEPDLVVLMQSQQARPVAVFIEAKLGAGKSGTGEDDQLARYLRIGDALHGLRPPIPQDAVHILLFLTTGDSRAELIESLKEYGDSRQALLRLYRLQWQDILETADEYKGVGDPISRLVLRDVSDFLRARELEHFRGMRIRSVLPNFNASDGLLFASAPLLRDVVVHKDVDLIRGEWAHGH